MSDAPYRPRPTQQPIQQPNPFTSGDVTMQIPDVMDVDQFPSLGGDIGKPSDWGASVAHGKQHVGPRQEVNGVYVAGVLLQPGWLYIDGFDRTTGTLYGGPSSDLRYHDQWPLSRMIDDEVATRHKRQQQGLEELDDAIGNIAPLALQLASQEREDWLIPDTLDIEGYSSDGDSDGATDVADEGYL